jgi:hypothetical protein
MLRILAPVRKSEKKRLRKTAQKNGTPSSRAVATAKAG